LTFGYLLGAAVFAVALVMVVANLFSGSDLNPTVPLFSGFVLMIGSKLAGAAALRRSEHR
jgi:hypothetical protein